ncbi:preprotein translocase subunit YajC [Corynebacterium sp. TA-R-1]|uniref:Preprotein translocase subunit YajC n=1 Tax=Corynebacterium stercoris TaxID=2943490 RepID=A0ABT1FZI7_9CORY|nr:preprotein translocase subunit YajC [Corynebacterium stercoris]MCP1387184.1 preprotein translocase subunit YajC [Corynebacterium stercoris]
MEFLPLLLILILFVVPPMLLMRSQRKRQAEIEAMRASIVPGDRIINVAGFHGTVVANRGEVIDLEIAPGTVVQMESAGIMRKVEPTLADESETPTL